MTYNNREAAFTDISGLEEWREYIYPNGAYRISEPVRVHVTRKVNGDSHRLIDADGVRHYVPAGWIAFRFKGEWGVDTKPVIA